MLTTFLILTISFNTFKVNSAVDQNISQCSSESFTPTSWQSELVENTPSEPLLSELILENDTIYTIGIQSDDIDNSTSYLNNFESALTHDSIGSFDWSSVSDKETKIKIVQKALSGNNYQSIHLIFPKRDPKSLGEISLILSCILMDLSLKINVQVRKIEDWFDFNSTKLKSLQETLRFYESKGFTGSNSEESKIGSPILDLTLALDKRIKEIKTNLYTISDSLSVFINLINRAANVLNNYSSDNVNVRINSKAVEIKEKAKSLQTFIQKHSMSISKIDEIYKTFLEYEFEASLVIKKANFLEKNHIKALDIIKKYQSSGFSFDLTISSSDNPTELHTTKVVWEVAFDMLVKSLLQLAEVKKRLKPILNGAVEISQSEMLNSLKIFQKVEQEVKEIAKMFKLLT